MLHSVHCWVKVLCAVGGEMHLRRPPKEAIKLGVHQATNHQKQQIDPIFLSQDQDMDNIHWISQTQTLQILISIVWCMTNPYHFDQSPMPNMSSSPRPSLRLVFLLQEPPPPPEHAAPILQKGDIGWVDETSDSHFIEQNLLSDTFSGSRPPSRNGGLPPMQGERSVNCIIASATGVITMTTSITNAADIRNYIS